MEVRCQLHATAALPPGKEPLVPIERRLGGPLELGGWTRDKQLLTVKKCLLRNVAQSVRIGRPLWTR